MKLEIKDKYLDAAEFLMLHRFNKKRRLYLDQYFKFVAGKDENEARKELLNAAVFIAEMKSERSTENLIFIIRIPNGKMVIKILAGRTSAGAEMVILLGHEIDRS